VKFIDEAIIAVQSGDGGSGCVSFRREKFVPRGGPDGGDGGKGGDIVFKTTTRRRTLYQFQFRQRFKAKNGAPGQGKQKTGKNGQDLVIEIPPGTLVRNADTDQIIKDFIRPGETCILAEGGRGGRGNSRFKTSTHRTPRFAQPGETGRALNLKLELKLLADAGIIGLPNAGKSTLISVLSSVKPKIADYPFTTLTPNIGVARTQRSDPFVIADIPGLIEGAHKGAGLGIKFLRHIERTRVLVHLIDAAAIDADDPLKGLNTVNTEMAMFSPALARKPQIVVLNKMDLAGTESLAAKFEGAVQENPPLRISALTRSGITDLKTKILNMLDDVNEQ
jgi:GTP-binding protein